MSAEPIPAPPYYYDLHPTEEELMGENKLQTVGVKYFSDVLRWLFREFGWYIALNLNIFMTQDPLEKPTAPDIALFKGVVEAELPANLPSWTVGPWNTLFPGDSIAPAVVIEIGSQKTWKIDLEQKPGDYARMGVQEYFFFIPPSSSIPQKHKKPALRGWKFENERAIPLKNNRQGGIWSEELESWVVPDGDLLRLYDRAFHLRLTGEEAERAAKELAWTKLREFGINPETLS